MYSKILVALDGSRHSRAGAGIVLDLAHRIDSHVIAAHIYDARLHSRRFGQMEPILPKKYQKDKA
jgi:hypothetical protein